jgi:hypothetical protein
MTECAQGLVAKGAGTRYHGGNRANWVKVKSRETQDVIVGAVIGPISKPEAIVVSRLDLTGQLPIVGRSAPLSPAQSAELAGAAGPE